MKTVLSQNIWAVGRNYAAHAKEMGADVPAAPFFFLKSGACLQTGTEIHLPVWSQDIHHEMELALRLDESLNFSHITLALDLTARDIQSLAKTKGLPWTQSKSFSGSCPVGDWLSFEQNKGLDLQRLNLQLYKNEVRVQAGSTAQMLFKPDELLQELKKYYPLRAGDVVLTGTPEGVGPLKSGDRLKAVLEMQEHTLLTCHWAVL
jgi:acylpyruvate hydrolase